MKKLKSKWKSKTTVIPAPPVSETPVSEAQDETLPIPAAAAPQKRAKRTRQKSTTVHGTEFILDERYNVGDAIGRGATGFVVSAHDHEHGTDVAIKKVTNAFDDPRYAMRFLREIQIMRFMDHPNVLGVLDIQIPQIDEFNDIQIVLDRLDADLHSVIRTQRELLTQNHWAFFIYQTLCGVKYMHSANVVHRDLKPSNLLVDMNCNLKICDFGLSRGIKENELDLTEYVVTRWYRAPEIMLGCRSYDKPIDVWAVGCILGEVLQGAPLFPGQDYVAMLKMIIEFLGMPTEAEVDFVENPRAKKFLLSLPNVPPLPLAARFPDAPAPALDLLAKMLVLDPAHRITAEQALAHPYFADLHDPAEEPVSTSLFVFPYEEAELDAGSLRRLVEQEVLAVRARAVEKRKQQAEALAAEQAVAQGDTIVGSGPPTADATATAATPVAAATGGSGAVPSSAPLPVAAAADSSVEAGGLPGSIPPNN